MIETHRIGRKIRNRRETLGWSLELASEKCEMSSRALEDIELGKTAPHLSTILKITHALDLDVGELNIGYSTLPR